MNDPIDFFSFRVKFVRNSVLFICRLGRGGSSKGGGGGGGGGGAGRGEQAAVISHSEDFTIFVKVF